MNEKYPGFLTAIDDDAGMAEAPARPKYPGVPTVIHGNGAVAEVMSHVCGGVIGYPITPSTEIAELYEAFRASGGCNVWGRHPFFFEPECSPSGSKKNPRASIRRRAARLALP